MVNSIADYRKLKKDIEKDPEGHFPINFKDYKKYEEYYLPSNFRFYWIENENKFNFLNVENIKFKTH